MNGICPNCEKETKLEHVCAKEVVEVRGEPIEVDSEYFKCMECGEEFENTRGPDSLALAYEKYRHTHEMLQPSQIREHRKRYGLTQKELSCLLGWGDVTLSRYENGALHSEAHEKILRLAMEPHNLMTLIENTPGALAEDKRERLLDCLRVADNEVFSFKRLFEEQFGQYAPDEFSGYRKLDTQKLFRVILFFCFEGQLKTKLNKLLFYADFKHFKEYAVSITGARYLHLQYGPVPDGYDYYFAELEREGSLQQLEVSLGGYTGFKCVTQDEPDLSIFEQSELGSLKEVKAYFKRFGSARIMAFSHKEVGYRSTNEGEPISYLFAESLRI